MLIPYSGQIKLHISNIWKFPEENKSGQNVWTQVSAPSGKFSNTKNMNEGRKNANRNSGSV